MPCAVDPVTHQGGMRRDLRGGEIKVPGVIRLPCGAGQGTGPHHAQCLYSWFVHAPDIKVALKYPKI